jgi:hypothetical protein
MVLHPLTHASSTSRSPVAAWKAVEQSQKCLSREWHLVAQLDHAVLAGDLAARLDFHSVPSLSPEIVRAIGLHDEGWAKLDAAAIDRCLRGNGPPQSFLEIEPAEFLIAWAGSIEAGESCGPLGGLIVSGHFQRLAGVRLESRQDSAADTERLKQFLEGERRRERILRQRTAATDSEVSVLTDVLQFCDLVSLYLCSGSREAVAFPQRFGDTTVTARVDGDVYQFSPAVFAAGTSLGVSARRYPGGEPRVLALVLW